MDQVSRPLQILLILVLGFAGLWFVALRPKKDTGGAPAPAPAPAASAPATSTPQKSAIPGGLGRAVDKARQTKVQGDAAAATRPDQLDAAAAGTQNTTEAPVQTPPTAPAKPADRSPTVGASVTIGRAGTVAFGRIDVGVHRAMSASDAAIAARRAAHRSARPGFATPAKVRAALAKRHVVVLLFFNARASDDRAVRGEIAAVNRRGGRVQVYGVSIRGLPRFKNVMKGVQVLQSPTVVVLSHRTPYLFPGYTDRAEIDQAAAVALRSRA
jgi:hypothetical protein